MNIVESTIFFYRYNHYRRQGLAHSTACETLGVNLIEAKIMLTTVKRIRVWKTLLEIAIVEMCAIELRHEYIAEVFNVEDSYVSAVSKKYAVAGLPARVRSALVLAASEPATGSERS